jgi:ClpP class serine protease
MANPAAVRLEPGLVTESRSGKLATIAVQGLLAGGLRITSPLDAFGGDVMTLDHLAEAVRRADADPEVAAIQLQFTGAEGTTVDRLMTTAQVIADASTPIGAWVETAMSGAAFLATRADVVGGPPTASIGSLSAYTGFRVAHDGDNYRAFSPSQLKADMAQGKLTSEVRDHLEATAASLAAAISPMLAKARRLSPVALRKATSGTTFVGEEAVAAGLIDTIYNSQTEFEAHLMTLAEERKTMADPTPTPQAGTPDDEARSFLQRMQALLTPAAAVQQPTPVAAAPTDSALAQKLDALAGQIGALAGKVDTLASSDASRQAAAERAAHAALAGQLNAAGKIPAAAVDAQASAIMSLQKSDAAAAASLLEAMTSGPAAIDFGDFKMPGPPVAATTTTGAVMSSADAGAIRAIQAAEAAQTPTEKAAILERAYAAREARR